MSREERTQKFKYETSVKYALTIIEYLNDNYDSEDLEIDDFDDMGGGSMFFSEEFDIACLLDQLSSKVSGCFKYLYKDTELVEKLEDLNLIRWNSRSILDHESLSNNPNLSIKWLELYPDKDWNWQVICEHDNIKLSWLDKLGDQLTFWKTLSKNENLKKEWEESKNTIEWETYCLNKHKEKVDFVKNLYQESDEEYISLLN